MAADIVAQALAGNIQLTQQFGSAFETGVKIAQAAEAAKMDNSIKQQQLKLNEQDLKFKFEEKGIDLLKYAFDEKTNAKVRRSAIDQADTLRQRAGYAPMNPEFKELANYDPNVGMLLAQAAQKKYEMARDGTDPRIVAEYQQQFDNIVQRGIADAPSVTRLLNEMIKPQISALGPLTERKEKANIIRDAQYEATQLENELIKGSGEYTPDDLTFDALTAIKSLPENADLNDKSVQAKLAMFRKEVMRVKSELNKSNASLEKEKRVEGAKSYVRGIIEKIPPAPFLTKKIEDLNNRLSDETDTAKVRGEIVKEAVKLDRMAKAYQEGRADDTAALDIIKTYNSDMNKIESANITSVTALQKLKDVLKNPKAANFSRIKPLLARAMGEVGNLAGQEQAWQDPLSNLTNAQLFVDSWIGRKWDREADQGAIKALERIVSETESAINSAYSGSYSNLLGQVSSQRANRFIDHAYKSGLKDTMVNAAVRTGFYNNEIYKAMTPTQRVKAIKKAAGIDDKEAVKQMHETNKQLGLE